MIREVPKIRSFRGLHTAHVRIVILMALIVRGSLLGGREASANAAMVAAAQTADGGIAACGKNRGKALYDCIANVLDKLSSDISNVNVPATRGALQTAASKLRAGGYVEGWGGGSASGAGFAAIAGVLGHAAKLIQAKG